MTDTTAETRLAASPHPALKPLQKLVGTWLVTGRESGPQGEIEGQVTFAWFPGGHFLVQNPHLDYIGREIRSVEYIGYDPTRNVLVSHIFDNTGTILKYAWEVDEHTLTIWGGDVGTPVRYRGTFAEDGTTVTGRWEMPADTRLNRVTGEFEWTDERTKTGYDATMTRVS